MSVCVYVCMSVSVSVSVYVLVCGCVCMSVSVYHVSIMLIFTNILSFQMMGAIHGIEWEEDG